MRDIWIWALLILNAVTWVITRDVARKKGYSKGYLDGRLYQATKVLDMLNERVGVTK